MKSERSSYAMSAVVIGTYVFALYGARGTPVDAKAAPPRTPITIVDAPTTQPSDDAMADVSVDMR